MALGIGAVGGSAVSAFNQADAARLSALTAGENPKVRPSTHHLAPNQCYTASQHSVKPYLCLTLADIGGPLFLCEPLCNITMNEWDTLFAHNGRHQTDLLSEYELMAWYNNLVLLRSRQCRQASKRMAFTPRQPQGLARTLALFPPSSGMSSQWLRSRTGTPKQTNLQHLLGSASPDCPLHCSRAVF